MARIFKLNDRPSWGAIALLLAAGVVFVGFGNADRLFWRLTSQGATLPGVVVEVRSYRPPEAKADLQVPKVVFRDRNGAIRVMEPTGRLSRYSFEVDQPVLVKQLGGADAIAVDVLFRRTLVTSVVMSLFTALGIAAWLSGIWMIVRRIWHSAVGVRQVS